MVDADKELGLNLRVAVLRNDRKVSKQMDAPHPRICAAAAYSR